MKYKIAIIGFGTVGQGFAEILEEERGWLKEKYELEFDVVAISDPIKGSIYNEAGLDLRQVLSLVGQGFSLDKYPGGIRSSETCLAQSKGLDSIQTITSTDSNIIVEVTPTDIKTAEPGITHIKTALNNRKHVITTNKGPVALAYHELSKLANDNGVFFRFEGTVLAGTPALNLGLEALAGIRMREIRGILNGTTNYILTEMENGKTYTEALAEAQGLGYAEANPSADVEGWDAMAKVLILGNVVMGGNLKVSDVERRGITEITAEDIKKAKAENKRYKLIGKVWKDDCRGRPECLPTIKASVKPEKLSKDDFLAQVSGVKNALTFVTDDLGEVTIVGPGAGRRETGFATLTDLISLHRSLASTSRR